MKKVYDGIIGLAMGDAIGVPVEFINRQEIAENPVVSMSKNSARFFMDDGMNAEAVS